LRAAQFVDGLEIPEVENDKVLDHLVGQERADDRVSFLVLLLE